jgi:hypothetical protein
MTLRKGRPHLQSQRANDTIVAVITLQDDAAEGRHCGPALCAELEGYCLPTRQVKPGERPTGKARNLS